MEDKAMEDKIMEFGQLSLTSNIEESLWSAIRSIRESVMLLNQLGDHFAELNRPRMAATCFKKAKEAQERAGIVQKSVMDHEQLSADNLEQQAT